MTAFEFVDHKERLGLVRKQLASLLGLSDSAVGLFERGVQPISPLLAKVMQALVKAHQEERVERNPSIDSIGANDRPRSFAGPHPTGSHADSDGRTLGH